MPSQPEETAEQDVRHILQFAMLATAGLELAHRGSGAARSVRLYPAEERALLGSLAAIKERAEAALAKLAGPRVPLAYLAGEGPAKMLRFYWCLGCGVNHWEDDRAKYDDHILHAGRIEYGHRTVELVR